MTSLPWVLCRRGTLADPWVDRAALDWVVECGDVGESPLGTVTSGAVVHKKQTLILRVPGQEILA